LLQQTRGSVISAVSFLLTVSGSKVSEVLDAVVRQPKYRQIGTSSALNPLGYLAVLTECCHAKFGSTPRSILQVPREKRIRVMLKATLPPVIREMYVEQPELQVACHVLANKVGTGAGTGAEDMGCAEMVSHPNFLCDRLCHWIQKKSGKKRAFLDMNFQRSVVKRLLSLGTVGPDVAQTLKARWGEERAFLDMNFQRSVVKRLLSLGTVGPDVAQTLKARWDEEQAVWRRTVQQVEAFKNNSK